MPGEFEIIQRYFKRRSDDAAIVTGIGDDGAVLRPAAGQELVVVTDSLVAGRHFPADTDPADIGWRCLAVNLSDCAAMGATPRWVFLNIALPEADEAWLEGFAGGFFELAEREDVTLAGGDTTRGPLCITVTLLGELPAGAAITRSGAQPGDAILVTGWPGRARAALENWRAGRPVAAGLQQAWQRPEPLTAAVHSLRRHATASIDVSDGLVADLGHVLAASDCGASLDADALPVADALAETVGEDVIDYVLHGGDDYELCICCPEQQVEDCLRELADAGIVAHRIGRVEAEAGLRLSTSDGDTWELPITGFDHFGSEE